MAETSSRLTGPRLRVLVPGAAVAALLTACGTGNVSPRASTPTSTVPSVSPTATPMAYAPLDTAAAASVVPTSAEDSASRRVVSRAATEDD